MNKITISVNKDRQVSVHFEEPIDLPEFLTITFTGMLGVMQGAITQIAADNPDYTEQQLTEEIYDMFNAGAGNILDILMPEPSNQADVLTAEAIMKAENELLDQVSLEEVIEDQNIM